MKNKLHNFVVGTVDFVSPYVKEAGSYASETFKSTGRKIRKKTRKTKMHIKLLKIKKVLDFASSVILLAATVLALLLAIGEYLSSKEI